MMIVIIKHQSQNRIAIFTRYCSATAFFVALMKTECTKLRVQTSHAFSFIFVPSLKKVQPVRKEPECAKHEVLRHVSLLSMETIAIHVYVIVSY